MSENKITAVVVVDARKQMSKVLLQDTLNSLINQDDKNFNIYIVQNLKFEMDNDIIIPENSLIQMCEYEKPMWFVKQQGIERVKTSHFILVEIGDTFHPKFFEFFNKFIDKYDILECNSRTQNTNYSDTDFTEFNSKSSLLFGLFNSQNFFIKSKIIRKSLCMYTPFSNTFNSIVYPIFDGGGLMDEVGLLLYSCNRAHNFLFTENRLYNINEDYNATNSKGKSVYALPRIIDGYYQLLIGFRKLKIYNSDIWRKLVKYVYDNIADMQSFIYHVEEPEKLSFLCHEMENILNKMSQDFNINFHSGALHKNKLEQLMVGPES